MLVVLVDLLEPDRPEVHLTDVNMCTSLRGLGAQTILFLRLLDVRGVHMSSGSFCIFNLNRRDRLIQGYRHKMKKVAPSEWNERKFIFFFEKQKQFGEGATFADVPVT